MAVDPVDIPWPLSSYPGALPQESSGRLINCAAEPLGDQGQGKPKIVWHRQPGLSQHATTAQAGYRGGLIVNNLAYENWSGNTSTVDTNGVVTSLGSFPGTKKISIARNQKTPNPDVVAVDIDNGAFQLSGGGAPVAYNGGGNLPQPNSVCFQDGLFFFGIADCRIFASGINALTQNGQTFTTMQAKATANGQRVIAYAGLLFGFTTISCEVYQDTAQPSPGFPYSRLMVIEHGLIQPNAIAGFEEGFSDLLWVDQDYGVWRLPPGFLVPQKVSSPDLDRLIQTQVVAGNALEASCYAFGGKKFWCLSSPAWSWELNLNTGKWNERWSLGTLGNFGRWRASGGHPAFGKWLMGDAQSGNLLFIDPTNFTENGAVQLFRMESGLAQAFPNRLRIARADFNFAMGTGIATGGAANIVNPVCAISWSNDTGLKWGNPIIRSLGHQAIAKTQRVSVKNTGQTGPQGRRWRLDVSDPVPVGFISATQSTNPREN